MLRTPRQFGRCLIALAALCAATAWGPASASACEAMRAKSGTACAAACSCCRAELADRAPRGIAAEATRQPEVRPAAPSPARVCEPAPAEDCGCRPAPVEAPPIDNRRPVEPPRPRLLPAGMALLPIVADLIPASFGLSRTPRVVPPPGPRLYLLNARFLI